MLGALEARAKASGAGDDLAERLAMAKGTLDNLETRLRDLDRIGPFKRTLMGWGVMPTPSWLDQPARLFAKVKFSPKQARKEIASALTAEPALDASIKALDARLKGDNQSKFLQLVQGTLQSGDPASIEKVKALTDRLARMVPAKGGRVDLSPLVRVGLEGGNIDACRAFLDRVRVFETLASSPSKKLEGLARKAIKLTRDLDAAQIETLATALRRIEGSPHVGVRNAAIDALEKQRGTLESQRVFLSQVSTLLGDDNGHLLLGPALKSKKVAAAVEDASAIVSSPNLPRRDGSRASFLEGLAPGRFHRRDAGQILANIRQVLEDPQAERWMRGIAQSRFIGTGPARLRALGARLASLDAAQGKALFEALHLSVLDHRALLNAGVAPSLLDRVVHHALTGDMPDPAAFVYGAHQLLFQAQHGVSPQAVSRILDRAARGTPDMGWLGAILQSGKLEPWMLEHLASIDNFAWNSIKKGSAPGASASDVAEAVSKLKGAVGEYATPHAIRQQLDLPDNVHFESQAKGIPGTDVDLLAKWVDSGKHWSQPIEVKSWTRDTWESALHAYGWAKRDLTPVNVAAPGKKPKLVPKGLADRIDDLRRRAAETYRMAKLELNPDRAADLKKYAGSLYKEANSLGGDYGKIHHLQKQLEAAAAWHQANPGSTRPPLLVATTDLDQVSRWAKRLYDDFLAGIPAVSELQPRLQAGWIEAYLQHYSRAFGVK
jgi:hypothetical protein